MSKTPLSPSSFRRHLSSPRPTLTSEYLLFRQGQYVLVKTAADHMTLENSFRSIPQLARYKNKHLLVLLLRKIALVSFIDSAFPEK